MLPYAVCRPMVLSKTACWSGMAGLMDSQVFSFKDEKGDQIQQNACLPLQENGHTTRYMFVPAPDQICILLQAM